MNSFIRAGEKVQKTEERLHGIIPLEIYPPSTLPIHNDFSHYYPILQNNVCQISNGTRLVRNHNHIPISWYMPVQQTNTESRIKIITSRVIATRF